MICRLLDEIEEQVPWEGPGRHKTIQHWRALERIRERRDQRQ